MDKKPLRPERPLTLTQIILKTSIVTFCIAFATFSYGIAVFGWAFPSVMAKLSDSLGVEDVAGMYYERVYNRKSTPENLYMTLDRYILAQNHRKVVTYGSKFLDLDESDKEICKYCKVIGRVNSHYEEKAGTSKIKFLQWGNEDSRIKSAYTLALIKTNKRARARARLEEWVMGTPDIKQPNHAFVVAFLEDSQAIEGRPTTRDLLVEYVDKFETVLETGGANIFALDFLVEAHIRLNRMDKASQYARALDGLL